MNDLSEETIFQHVEEGRAIVAASQVKSRRARRDKSRVSHLERAAPFVPPCPADECGIVEVPVSPRRDVEIY